MLKNFNNLFKSILKEEISIDINNEDDVNRIKRAYNTNEFFLSFIQPLADKVNVRASKQRNNCFMVAGLNKNVIDFFKNFKVDKSYMDNPNDLALYSPAFTFGERQANLKFDQYYPVDNFKKTDAPFTHELENVDGEVVEGYWRKINTKFADPNEKSIKPKDLAKRLSEICKSIRTEDNLIYVEFQINVEGLKNLLWDEMSEFAKDPDEMNEYHNSLDDIEFDYKKLNVKNK